MDDGIADGSHYWDLGGGAGAYDAAANEARLAAAGYTPAMRDTTQLYRYAVSGAPHSTNGWRAWRIRVTRDNVGAWGFHCHILAHMAMGEEA